VRVGGRSLLLALATVLLLLSAPHPALADSARTLCTIRDQRIDESSGLAASADRLWTMNDGGTRLRVFELDWSCRVLRTLDAGIDPYDVEDLARARDGTFWLADTGDNGLNRSTVAVERLRPDGDVAAAISSGQRRRIPLPPTAQGEAVTFTPDGRSLLTSTEGVPAPVQVIPLGDAAPTPTRAADAPTAAGPAEPDSESGDLLRTLAAPLVVVVAMGAVISYAVTRRR
jgi:hypothetical protein